MKSLLIIITLLCKYGSCSAQPILKTTTCSNLVVATADDTLKTQIDSLWNKLAFEKGGCLTGGQYSYNGVFGGEHCVLTDDAEWKRFFTYPQKELSEFLISKMSDTTATRIHTCPFYHATAGELAVYCLQRIYRINWYDFKEFEEYKNREITHSLDCHQAWLQKILSDRKKRTVLENLWRGEMKK